MNTHYNHKDEKPLGELFSELSRGVSSMFRQEVELAKAELSQKAKQALKDAPFLSPGRFWLSAGSWCSWGCWLQRSRT